MKKLFLLILAVVSMMCIFAFSSSAAVPTAMGDCIIGEGEDKIVKAPTQGLEYSVLDVVNKTATLSGNGGITSGEIVIASTVEISGETYTVVQTNAYVFSGSSITAIYVPNTVERILGSTSTRLDDSGTFANCFMLSEVYIGTGIKEIGRFCFTSIGKTSTVSKFIVKGKPQIIKEYAFNCANFNDNCKIECDTSDLRTIESNAFANKGKAIKVINSPVLESIGERAFGSSSNIEYVLVPENCTLGKYVFNGLSNLKTVVIKCAEGEVKELPQETFSNDSKFDLYIDGQVIATGNHVLGFGDMRVYFENYEDIGVFVESVNSGYQGSDRLSYVKFFTCNPSDDGYYKFKANTSSVITPDTTVTAPVHALLTVGIVIDATCSSFQKTYDLCEICDSECNVVMGESYDEANHAYETIEMEAPSCVKNGYEIKKCTLCNKTIEIVLDALGHDFVAKIKAPTCTSIGYTTYTCKTCGHAEIGDKTPKNDSHTYVALEPYVSNDGKLVSKTVCLNCGTEGQSEEVSLLNKTYIKGYKTEIFDASSGLTFTYSSESKTATVTGGTLASTDLYIPSFVEYNGEIYKVTTVAQKAFQGVGLTKVFVPDTVTELKGGSGTGCFGNNMSLTTIVVGSGVTKVEQEIFSMLSKATVEEFIFKGTITYIGSNAFNYVYATDVMTGYEFNTRLEYVGAFIQGSNGGNTPNLIKEIYITYDCDISAECCFNGVAGLKTVYIEGGKTAEEAKVLTRELFSGPATNMNIYISGYVTVPTIDGDIYTGRAVLPTTGAHIYMQSQDAMRVFIAAMAHNDYSDRATNSTWYDCETQTYFKIKTKSTDPDAIEFNTSLGIANHQKLTTTVAPTCTSEGRESIDCFVCSKNFKSEAIEKLDHVHTNEQILGMPNCKDEGSISFTCASCGEDIVEAIAIDPEYHNYVLDIVFENGLDKNGEKYRQCENCDDKIDIIILKPIFVAKGYSMNSDGDAIIAGFAIDSELLKEYRAIHDVKFGLMIGNAGYFNGDDFIVDGKLVNEYGIQLEIVSVDYDMIKCTITGFDESYDDLELVISLYVIDESGNVSYIQKAGGDYYQRTVQKNGVELGAFTRTTIRSALDKLVESASIKAVIPGDEE